RLSRCFRPKRALESSIPPDIISLLKSKPITLPLMLQVTPPHEQQSVALGFQDTALLKVKN
ncbi:hypothetical protein Tco_0562964, partial [Tanacetum coccineum]